jgi:hypothetical protein
MSAASLSARSGVNTGDLEAPVPDPPMSSETFSCSFWALSSKNSSIFWRGFSGLASATHMIMSLMVSMTLNCCRYALVCIFGCALYPIIDCTQSKRVEVGLTTAFVEPYCAERGVCTSNSDCGDRREECDGKMFAGAGFGESCSKGALSSEDCAVKQSPDGEASEGSLAPCCDIDLRDHSLLRRHGSSKAFQGHWHHSVLEGSADTTRRQ